MDQGVLRTRLYWVGGGYAAVAALSAALIVLRYLQYVTHPADVAQYGGMWAGGDLMLELFITGLLLVVTFFLVLVIRKEESAYTVYSKVLLGLSLTAPLSVGFISIDAVSQGTGWLGYACLFRLFASPMVIVGLGGSRLLARFSRAKRLLSYSLIIEGLTLVGMFGLLGVISHFH
ncbi:MAG TPA: hypothetical protein VFO46_10535 [Candidatus Sulfotelmatobacter sp.]|nr:hypothetical protein [Candidatus Sulfotelmatobacter sp.]